MVRISAYISLGLLILGLSTPSFVGAVEGESCDSLLSGTQSSHAVSLANLESAISQRLEKVDEFRELRAYCQSQGIRCWLFGGTAAGYAHYVKWHLLQGSGDTRFQKDRFDYDYTNIFRSTQDADLVIDGTLEQAEALERFLRERFPHFQGSKSVWEVRLLREQRGEKEPLLDHADFLHQHTDSNSTGMIEVSAPPAGEAVVRDLRDWNPADGRAPIFLQDVWRGKLHYYYSDQHWDTQRFKQGKNPPILSVIRYLTKAFQYELEILPEDRAEIQRLIDAFHPVSIHEEYVQGWIEKNGKKLIQHAVNIEYAWNTLEELGLRKKLIELSGDVRKPDSLAWWLNREPLPSFELGQGSGKTAAEIGISLVSHETNEYLSFESITRAHTGEANVLKSRNGALGESAVHGDGFYVAVGRKGARGTGLTVRMTLNPAAREGSDFLLADASQGLHEGSYLVILNKRALRVIPESLDLGVVEYFEMLVNSGDIEASNRGILEKLRRRVRNKVGTLKPDRLHRILELVRPLITVRYATPAIAKKFHVLREFLDLTSSCPAFLLGEVRRDAVNALLRDGVYGAFGGSDHRDTVIRIFHEVRPQDQVVLDFLLSELEKNDVAYRDYVARVLGAIAPQDPRVFDTLVERFKFEEAAVLPGLTFALGRYLEVGEVAAGSGALDAVLRRLEAEFRAEHPDPELIRALLEVDSWKDFPGVREAQTLAFLGIIRLLQDRNNYFKHPMGYGNFDAFAEAMFAGIEPQDPRILEAVLEWHQRDSKSYSLMVKILSRGRFADSRLFGFYMKVGALTPDQTTQLNFYDVARGLDSIDIPLADFEGSFEEYLFHPNRALRLHAVKLVGRTSRVSPRLWKKLVEATRDPDDGIRYEAIHGVLAHGMATPSNHQVFIHVLLNDPVDTHREAAMRYFLRHSPTDRKVIAALLQSFDSKNSPTVGNQLFHAVHYIRDRLPLGSHDRQVMDHFLDNLVSPSALQEAKDYFSRDPEARP